MNKKQYCFSILFTSFCLLFLAGCKKNGAFITDGGLDDRLQGTWKVLDVEPNVLPQDWEFQSPGTLYITTHDPAGGPDFLEEVKYQADGRLSRSRLNISNYSNALWNGEWSIMLIDAEVLVISKPYTGCPPPQKECGLMTKEFTR